MFSSKSVKKVEKAFSKFFIFNEGICRSEESRSIREIDDDDANGGGKDVRVLSNPSSDGGEDGGDNDDGDSSDGGDDNNGGNNSVDGGTYNLEGHIQELILTSDQHYCVGYDYDYRPQLEKFMSTSTGLSAYRENDYDNDFVPHRNLLWK